MEPQYKLEEDGYFIEQDATFSIDDFMRDLERFFQAMRMHFAFEEMCQGYDYWAEILYKDGKHFAGLPFFEQFKYDPEDAPELDYSSANGDLLKMMQMDAEEADAVETDGEFYRAVFDHYEELQEKLVDMIPDFRVRLKVNPKTRKWFLLRMSILCLISAGIPSPVNCLRMLPLRIKTAGRRIQTYMIRTSMKALLCPALSVAKRLSAEIIVQLFVASRNARRL
jgi:hypothetical protein